MNSDKVCTECGKALPGDVARCPCCDNPASSSIKSASTFAIEGYRFLRTIGTGGMANVYLAEDQTLGRQVAIKVMSGKFAADPDGQSRFLREARAMAAVHHPNVVEVHAFGHTGNSAYLVMEYVEGESLSQRLKRLGPLSVDEALSILRTIILALQAVWEKGIVHRDIKPSNILISKEGNVHVADFGLAKPISSEKDISITQTGVMTGTPGYIAPEQALSHPTDCRTDIYSLGIVLYEMLSGELPFQGTNPVAIIEQHLNAPLPSVRDRHPEIPKGMDRLIEWMTQKNPSRRPSSYEELLQKIDTVQSGDNLSNIRTNFVPYLPGRRSPVSTVVTRNKVLSVVFLAVIILLIWIIATEQRPEPNTLMFNGEPSIAVLPFVDLSPKKDQEYFSDGLTEELLSVLSRNPKLKVAARASSFYFKGKDVKLSEISRELNVCTILEGSVRKSGNQLRITAQLINAEDGYHIWSQTYNRDLDDIFSVQSDIAASVAEALQVELKVDPISRSEENVNVYNLYLQGNYFWGQYSEEGFRKALDYFEQALRIDPEYAPAWIGLAKTRFRLAGLGYDPTEEGFKEGRQAVERALELNRNLAEAHAVLGWFQSTRDWDWTSADASFQRALELDPTNTSVLRSASAMALTLGRLQEALSLSHKAVELDPLSLPAHYSLGIIAFNSGNLAEAEAEYRKILEMNPQFPGAYMSLGTILLGQSKPEAALAEMQKETELTWRRYGLALALHAVHRNSEADAALAEVIEKDGDDSAIQIAEIYAFRGEIEPAFRWLERAYSQRDPGLASLKNNVLLNSLHDDPRWNIFLKKMNLPLD